MLLASVTQGVTEDTFTPLKEKVWDVVELLLLMATITTVEGAEELFLKADSETPEEGASVAPMR